jgi:pilus assembly protein CpaD
MIRNFLKLHSACTHGAAILLCGTVLAGCNAEELALDDRYSPSYDERYAIAVEKRPVRMGVVQHDGTLSAEQINAVSGFAGEAKTNAQSVVTIKYPSGSPGAREAAQDIAELMVQRGVPPSKIRAASYSGGRGAPVEVAFLRKVAVTKACGDWSSNLGVEKGNNGYENFGCSIRHNMAAMVANPEDFEVPRAMEPTLAGNRMAALKIYIKNPWAGSRSATTISAESSGDSSAGGGGGGGGEGE